MVKRAFIASRNRLGGIHLGLNVRYGVDILWQGKSGMRWWEVKKKVSQLLRIDDQPDILVIHCGE